jgi:hypothetical protein
MGQDDKLRACYQDSFYDWVRWEQVHWTNLCTGRSNRLDVRCAFSGRNLHSRMPLDPTQVRLKLLHACDQLHSSRASTPLTGWHCKLCPTTEGLRCWKKQDCLFLCVLQVPKTHGQPCFAQRASPCTVRVFGIYLHSRVHWFPHLLA